jgi:hypothetical protein
MKRVFTVFITVSFLVVSTAYSAQREWRVKKSTHFVVYYKNAPLDFIDKVVDAAEDYYREITFDLGFVRHDYWLWEDRAKIYIYEDPEDYQKASIEHSQWSGGIAFYREKRINTFPWDAGFFDTLLPHELGHIIFREFIGFDADVPLWLDEGVACFQEKARRWGSERIVRSAIDHNVFIPLNELSEITRYSLRDKNVRDLFYAESASIVYFLIVKQGKQGFVKLCKALRDGKKLDEAISYAYIKYDNLQELNDAWVRDLIR